MAHALKKEWIWLLVLSIGIALIIPWSILRWQKEIKSKSDLDIRVLMPDGKVSKIPLENYLIGVTAAEMPAEFNMEALKAQAVAARTYAVKRIVQKNDDVGYDVDTTVLTQAWLSDQDMRKKWGWMNYWVYYRKLQKAVETTRGMVLIYNGEYIDAYYHSSSGRKPTEKSEDVWSSSRPYLTNVSFAEDNQLRYVKIFRYTPQELARILGIQPVPQYFNSNQFKILNRTSAGRVKSVQILGKVYPATQLRTLLGLPSTDLEWVVHSDVLIITTYGNGHAVGMSQWGANDMAQKKLKFEEILAHYYPGTKLLTIEQK